MTRGTTEWALGVLADKTAPLGRRLHASAELRRIAAEADQLAGAVEALRKYGWHDGVCPATLVDDPGPCECGWDDVARDHLEGS